ncbi:hypothetical protein, partial [Vibrio cholerae]|uniref:hypothetical protein n=5 Tax=Vibrio cholerae TaxID=666 RepID=UPI00321BA68E
MTDFLLFCHHNSQHGEVRVIQKNHCSKGSRSRIKELDGLNNQDNGTFIQKAKNPVLRLGFVISGGADGTRTRD